MKNYREIKNNIEKILKNRIMVIDGAMGTMIQKYGLKEEDFRNEELRNHREDLFGNNDLLSVTRPDIIEKIHRDFLEAGADIIETNTFNGNSISQSDYNLGDMVSEINLKSARIASGLAEEFSRVNPEKPRFVAGSVGPTNVTLSMSPDVNDPGYRKVSFEELVGAYKEQIRALIEGGVDIILIETIFDTLNAKAAIFALNMVNEELGIEVPLMISGTITDNSGRTLSGQTLEAFYISISHASNLLSVGLNCALGSEEMRPYIIELSNISDYNTSLHPNAGLPNEFGEYDESPEFMQRVINGYVDEGFVNIVGGCCGTTPEHIGAIASGVAERVPRRVVEEGDGVGV